MAKQSAYLVRIQRAQVERDHEVGHHSRTFMLDMVTLTLGRMGKREAFFREFDKVLSAVCDEYSRDILEDAESDKELWYTKDVMDRELKQYVGAMFVPYDERYRR